jgi:hypothetical protein
VTPSQLEDTIGYAAWAVWWRASYFNAFLTEPEFALAVCHAKKTTRKALTSLARSGDVATHHALCDMATFLTEIGDSLPVWLQEYIVSAARLGWEPRKPRKRGRDPWNHFLRDAAIGQAVGMVTDAFCLAATRNEATTAECGCSIVAIALDRYTDVDMTEANVVAIWGRTVKRQQLLRPTEPLNEPPGILEELAFLRKHQARQGDGPRARARDAHDRHPSLPGGAQRGPVPLSSGPSKRAF